MKQPIWGAAVGVCLLTACGPEPEPVTLELKPTLETIHHQVFIPACAMQGCHAAETRAGDLDLSSPEASYLGLVGVMASNPVAFENRWQRVKPGDPELSFLMRKMTIPGIGEGAAMPPGDQAIRPYYLDLTATWIQEGASQ